MWVIRTRKWRIYAYPWFCHMIKGHIFSFLVKLLLQWTDLLFHVLASLDLVTSSFFLPVHHSRNSVPHLTLCFKTLWLPFPVPRTHFAHCSLSLPAQLTIQTLISGRFSSASSAYTPCPAVSQHILAYLTWVLLAPHAVSLLDPPAISKLPAELVLSPFLRHPHPYPKTHSLTSLLSLVTSPSSPR